MTVSSLPITSLNNECYIWHSIGKPLLPFYKREQMENRKYFDWIMANVENTKVKQYSRMHPQTGQETTMYHLNHMVRIGGQYENMDDARVAINRAKANPNHSRSANSELENSQVQLFGDYLTEFTATFSNDQRLISAEDFFNKVFPLLRPGTQTQVYLPALYRDHIHMNGKLVADGSSLAINLTNNNYENIASAPAGTQTMLESNLMASEQAAAPMLREELQGTRTVPPSQVAGLPAGGPIRNRRREFDINDLEIRPTNWEEQREAIRYQYDCSGEIEHQRRMNEKEKESQIRINERKLAHQEHLATLKHKHETAIAIFDHKQEFRINTSTRSQSRPRGPQAAVVVPAKMLIHPDWDVKNPATVIQAMAICIDHFFESSSSATEAVTLETFHDILIRVLTKNTLDFDSLCGESPVGSGSHYWREKDNINIAKEVISMAKTQFPKSFVKEVRGAWDSQTRDITCNKKMSMRYVRVRLDRIRELFSAFMQ